MTTIEEFLSNLSDRNITLWLDNNRLRYRASKENLTLEILTELKARKQEILNYLSSKQTLSNLIKPISRDEIIPLSFTQQRLWFLNQLVVYLDFRKSHTQHWDEAEIFKPKGVPIVISLNCSAQKLKHLDTIDKSSFVSVEDLVIALEKKLDSIDESESMDLSITNILGKILKDLKKGRFNFNIFYPLIRDIDIWFNFQRKRLLLKSK